MCVCVCVRVGGGGVLRDYGYVPGPSLVAFALRDIFV